LDWEDWKKLLPFYISQNFIFSHAGFHQSLFPVTGFDEKYFLELFRDTRSSLFNIGISRGGVSEHGGIYWQDWGEFGPIEPFNQIVGHTHNKSIQYKNYNSSVNVNVDCLPYYILSIEDGKLQEIKLI
jgi:hypothetical protein